MITQIIDKYYLDIKKICGLFGIIFLLFFSFSVRAEEKINNNEKKDKINIKADKVEYSFPEGEEIATFIGSVEMKKGDLTVFSDKMQMYSQGNKAVGEGNVKIVVDNEKESRELTSGYYEYHRDDEYVILKESPKMVIISKEQKSKKNNENNKNTIKYENLTITSDLMEMYSKDGYSKATGNVVIEEGDRTSYCDEAVYYEKEDKVIMTGSPRIEQKDNIFTGEKMTFFLNNDRLIIEGNVDGTILNKVKKNKEKNIEVNKEENKVENKKEIKID